MEETQKPSNIVSVDINKEMRDAYLQYSMSVIVGRALPDARDGLKPVHRRVLFAMNEMSNTHDKPYKKSARVVGDVIGKYHPHGDTAVYDTMVRMAQEFSLRFPLIDGQGNFGSIDGDSPAAMRYTEVRMTLLAEKLLEDIEKETVDYSPNYDDSLLIPDVLPAKFPNLLVNGSSGIAVGMATNIPPHNLGEVIDGCLEVITNPDVTLDKLIKLIPGPDFPTAGIISGRQGIVSAYKTGRGIVNLKAVAEIETLKGDRERIVVTELPFQVNKAKLIESIADLVRDKKIEGISDIRDESSREGMRMVIDVKKGENAGVVLNRLYKFTQLQTSFGVNMLALDAGNQPQVFDLKRLLTAFLDHRQEVVTRRCVFDLKKAEARIHILEGLKLALDRIDEVIATIKASKEANSAREALIAKFGLTEIQAQAILEMRLQRLTGLERDKIMSEIKELQDTIAWLKKVLADVTEIYKIIADELREIKAKYSNPRRTKIEGDSEEVVEEDLITKEEVVITITHSGYIKRIPIDTYRTQRRGGKGLNGMDTRDEDFVSEMFVADTHTTLLVFTDKGKVYWQKVYKLPEGTRTSKGKAIANVVNLSNNEKVQAILPVKEFRDDTFVVMLTKNGIIKKTELSAFSNPRPSGIIALTTDLDDSMIDAKISSGKDDIFIATEEGMSIRFDENNVRAMGRTARGVKGITLSKGDFVAGMEILGQSDLKKTILMVSEFGYGKRTETEEYRKQSRGGVGIITQKTTDKVGRVVATKLVDDSNDVMLITDKGTLIRLPCKQVSVLGRNTQGVRLINVYEGEKVSSMALVAESDVVSNEIADPSTLN